MGKKARCVCGRKARMFKPWASWPWEGYSEHCTSCGRKNKAVKRDAVPTVELRNAGPEPLTIVRLTDKPLFSVPKVMAVGTVHNLTPNADNARKELDRVLSLYTTRKRAPKAATPTLRPATIDASTMPDLCTVCYAQRARPNSTVVCEDCAADLAKSPDALIDVLESLGYTVGSVNDDDNKGADHADSRS